MANWKTYNKNFSVGNFLYPTVEIKYPSNWFVSEQSLEGTADKLITFKDSSGVSAVALQISVRDFLQDYGSQKQYLGSLVKENLGNYTFYRFKNKYGYIEAYYFPSENGFAAPQLLNEKFRTVWNQILSTFKFLDQNSVDLTAKMTVKVFFNNKKLANDQQFLYCDSVFPVSRILPYTQAVALTALNEWLKGPTDKEKTQGYSGGTDGGVSINSIKIINGQAHVDLHFSGADNWVVNARKYLAGTCGISSFLSQIGTTVEQFPTVTAKGKTIFSIDGSEERFNGLAQNP